MKIVLVVFLCLFFGFNVLAQNEDSGDVGIEAVLLARDDGSGKAGEETAVFTADDVPIHCSVQLNSMKPTSVKMNLIAVSVAGVKPETKVVTTSYKTNGKQNLVNFTGTPEGIWTIGKYRVDIFIDGKLSANREFEVQKSASQKKEGEIQIKSTKLKSNLKPKITNRIRKN